MTRLTLPIAAACAVFMAAALPATAQDQGPQLQSPRDSHVHGWHRRPADPNLALHMRMLSTMDKLQEQDAADISGKADHTCYSLSNNFEFVHRGPVTYSTELVGLVEIPAIAKGGKLAPAPDAGYTYYTDADALYDAHKAVLYGNDRTFAFDGASLVGCAADADDLRAAQAILNRQLLVNLENRITARADKNDTRGKGPKATL